MNESISSMQFNSEIANPDGLNFKSFILSKMKTVSGSDGRRTLTSAELSDALGLSTKVFQEILNGRRSGPDRRDLVIAICAQLALDAEDTNEALRLFPESLRPLSESDRRDRCIIDFLNAGFDSEISYDALNQQLSRRNLPVLKTRYRTQSQDDGWRKHAMNKINWGLRSEEERQRYNYYTSLNYDDKAATVLALFTYGDEEIDRFRIQEAYEAFLQDKPYPPKPEPEPEVMYECDDALDLDIRGLTLAPYTELEDSGGSAFDELDDDGELPDLESAPMAQTRPALSYPAPSRDEAASRPRLSMPKLSMPRFNSSIFSRSESRAANKSMKLRDFLTDTDEYQPIEEKDYRKSMRDFTSTFRMTTNTASTGVIFNQLRSGRSIDRSMVRIEEMLNYFRYRHEKPTDRMFRIDTEVKDLENRSKFLYIHVQGKEEIREKQNIVVLLDVSGSMGGNTVQTQAAVATIVSKLKPGDTFSLVTYSSEDHVVIDGLPIMAKDDITHILEKLLGLEIYGGTYGSAGIEKAYAIGKRNYRPGGNNQVILITDGDLNFGITSQGGLERLIEEKKKDKLFLSVIGTGLMNYKDNKLETLSKHGNGVYRVVNNLNDVKKSIRDEYASLVNIIAKDVKAQVEFNPETVESYRLLGFENRELSHEDFTNDKVISEPFGSGGYGIALYELRMQPHNTQQAAENRYTRVVTTGSSELCTVRIRYKEPLEDVSHEIEHVVADASEGYTDNLLLAHAVYVAAEKLRNSDKIEQRDEAIALMELDTLGTELQVMNLDDLVKLKEILRRSKEQLNVRRWDNDMPF